jgi:hypothetical protein
MSGLDEFKPKSFWQKKEGNTGLALVAGGIALAGWFGIKYAPLLIIAFENITHMLISGAILAIVSSPIWNDRIRLLTKNVFQSASRAITRLYTTIDPIGIMKNYVDTLRKRVESMEEKIGILSGSIRKLKNSISETERQIDHELSLAKQAQKEGKNNILLLSTNQAARLKDSNSKRLNTLKMLQGLYSVICVYKEKASTIMTDTDNEVTNKEQEWRDIKAGHSAMKSAMSVIMGDKDKELFDMAMEFSVNDIGQKVGEIERFLDTSKGFMDKVDLENGVYAEEGMKLLQSWGKEESIVLGDNKTLLVDKLGGLTLENNVHLESTNETVSAYRSMLNKK